MKNTRLLRMLSLLSFLLLMAPFYDQCNGHGMKKAEKATEAVAIDTTAIENPESKNSNIPIVKKEVICIKKDSISKIENNKTPFYKKAYEFVDDNNNENAFELANMSRVYFEGSFAGFKQELSKDFKKHRYDGLFLFIRSFSFVFIVFSSFFILILSLLKRFKWVYKFSIVNLSLIVITLICILFFDSLFETYKQIKWGYYAFIIINLLIFYYSKIQFQENKSVA